LVPDHQLIDMHRSQSEYIDRITEPKGVTGEYYTVLDCQGNPTGQIVFVPTGSPAPAVTVPPVDPATLAAEALKRMTFPKPVINMSPAVTQDQLVGLPTWLWVDAANLGTRTETVTAGPVSVTGTMKATNVVWDMGDGSRITCAGAGTAYNPAQPDAQPTCSYTYRRSSATRPSKTYVVRATIAWAGDYRVSGAPGGGPLGPVSQSSTVSVRVAENQSLNN
jgi:hypothetical protein